MIVLLDAGPLGMISNPKASIANRECYQWMESLVVKGAQVFQPGAGHRFPAVRLG